MKIISAAFIKSATEKAGWPRTGQPEVAFAGRSNVGKSSLINNLLNRRGLVKTSAEPGKTRLVNFFLINERFILTDLPGYGFARGDKDEVRRWKPMIEEYIGQREELRALVHIMDIRRIPDEDGMEGMMMEFALHADIPHILVANKSDKLSHSACLKSAREIEKALGKKPIIYSAKTGAGKEALWKELHPLLGR